MSDMQTMHATCPFCGTQPAVDLSGSTTFLCCDNEECILFGKRILDSDWNTRSTIQPPASADVRDSDETICELANRIVRYAHNKPAVEANLDAQRMIRQFRDAVMRSRMIELDMPPFMKVTNRVGVIFDGESPIIESALAA